MKRPHPFDHFIIPSRYIELLNNESLSTRLQRSDPSAKPLIEKLFTGERGGGKDIQGRSSLSVFPLFDVSVSNPIFGLFCPPREGEGSATIPSASLCSWTIDLNTTRGTRLYRGMLKEFLIRSWDRVFPCR